MNESWRSVVYNGLCFLMVAFCWIAVLIAWTAR